MTVRAAVLGGGVAGLTAAAELARCGVAVSLFEATGRLGGQVWTERSGGFTVEHGADGFPLPDAEARTIFTTLGLFDRLASQRTALTLALGDRGLKPLLPEDVAQTIGISVRPEARGRGTFCFPDGLDELVATLLLRARSVGSGAKIRRRCAVTRIARSATSWAIHTQHGSEDHAELVVVALPARESSTLLLPVLPQVADLPPAAADSSVSVTLAYRQRDVEHPLEATGFVVLDRRDIHRRGGLVACSFSSSKFPSRAPAGRVLVRAFYRPGENCPIAATDEMWAAHAIGDLSPVLGIHASPIRRWVARWPNALSRIDQRRVASVERLTGECHNGGTIQLAGAAYFGAGVLPAMTSGHRAARRLLELLDGRADVDAPDTASSTHEGST